MGKIDGYVQGWLRHRSVLLELLQGIDNEHTHFKPWNQAYSLGSLAVHIVSSTDMFVQAVKNGEFVPPSASNPFETMDDVRRIVQEYTEKTKDELQSLTEDQLEQIVVVNQFSAPGKAWINTAKEHEIHHKGQLFTYTRMIGVEKVPFFLNTAL
ncbi:DinB family protein [Paenibacillus sediminis]|uniref:Damage-inducible protein DinB n=1 Tax=Paenibacillus sediminis TaxID=664909 RepID=A0ABS4H4W5_9BACL|nr:DinB family protein [Paenibacillus sediminis]MBP1937580.1 putative damage-inducible protein DinB [Paenibacillus sediminis]